MVNLLIITLLAGAATAFSTEVVGAISDFWIFDPKTVKALSALPFAALFCWLLGLQMLALVVPSLAAAFLSLAVMRWLNRPVQVQQVVSRRLP
jgi:hypothetical protein